MNDIRNTLRENAEQLVILGKHSQNYAPSSSPQYFFLDQLYVGYQILNTKQLYSNVIVQYIKALWMWHQSTQGLNL